MDKWVRNTVDPDQIRIHQLIADLGSFNDQTRHAARINLIRMGKSAVPALSKALRTGNHQVRWGAVKALAEIADPETAPVLIQVLEDDVFDIRWIASEGLIAMGIAGLVPLLEALADECDIASVRESARHVIHVMSEMGLKNILLPVKEALDSIEPAVTVPPAARLVLEALRQEA